MNTVNRNNVFSIMLLLHCCTHLPSRSNFAVRCVGVPSLPIPSTLTLGGILFSQLDSVPGRRVRRCHFSFANNSVSGEKSNWKTGSEALPAYPLQAGSVTRETRVSRFYLALALTQTPMVIARRIVFALSDPSFKYVHNLMQCK